MFRVFDKIKNGEPYIIAEMSANHGGSLENALEIVRGAAKAGADCLKIQTYTADSLTIDCDKEYFEIHGTLWDGYHLYDLYREAGTPYEWQAQIKEECERMGMDFLSTPFDKNAVDFLEGIGCEAYKIASFELVDIPLIEYCASKGKPMIISCGMGNEEEIQDAVDACHRQGNHQIVLLKCCSEYPANWQDMHLANIPDMISKYNVAVGLSDHSEGYLAAVVGVSLGACVIEKHVKLEGVESADSKFSMTLDEFAQMVKAVKDTKTIIGKVSYGPTEGEKSLLPFRRSLFAVKDIKAGEEISAENVRSIRPSMGLKPKYFRSIEGLKAKEDISFGTPMIMDLVEQKEEEILKKIPTLKTRNLTLRPMMEKDADIVVKWRSNPSVYQYFINPHALSREEHLNWFYQIYQYQIDRFEWIAVDASGIPVGAFGLRKTKDEDCAEVSYLVDEKFYGMGYAMEAVNMLMEFADKTWKCRSILAQIHKENEKSIRFIKKLGFTQVQETDSFFDFKRDI